MEVTSQGGSSLEASNLDKLEVEAVWARDRKRVESGASANLPTLLFQCCFMRISQSYFYVILKNSADVAASQHFCLNVRPKKR